MIRLAARRVVGRDLSAPAAGQGVEPHNVREQRGLPKRIQKESMRVFALQQHSHFLRRGEPSWLISSWTIRDGGTSVAGVGSAVMSGCCVIAQESHCGGMMSIRFRPPDAWATDSLSCMLLAGASTRGACAVWMAVEKSVSESRKTRTRPDTISEDVECSVNIECRQS